MTVVRQALQDLTQRLKVVNSSRSALEARLLIAHLLNLTSEEVLIHDDRALSSTDLEQLEAMVQRRLAFEPIALILGVKEFFGLAMDVRKQVLVPRPETESLVEGVLQWIDDRSLSSGTILDVGTGSGCIAVTLSKILGPSFRVMALDISDHALALTKRNIEKHRVPVNVHKFDFEKTEWVEPWTILISNPPYIPRAELSQLSRDIQDYEPVLALSGGEDGLRAFLKIQENFFGTRAEQSLIAFETHGEAQRVQVAEKLFSSLEAAERLWHDGPHLFHERWVESF